MSITKLYTAEDLFALGSDAHFELIDGELQDVPSSGMYSSSLSVRLLIKLGSYVERHDLGVLTGEDGGYVLQRSPDRVVSPDIGFVRKDRLPGGEAPEFFCPVPPDLAIEIMSATDRLIDAERKVQRYLDAGTPLVWLVISKTRTVRVYGPGREPSDLVSGDVLDGEEVLPGFRLPVADVFPGRR
ncbi:MAG: Uma2 family endonuclease [Thermomicrobiales bacterium]